MAFDEIINLRLTGELKARLIRLTRQPENRGRDVVPLARIAFEDYCDEWERKLGVQPITPEEIEEYKTLLAERSRTTPAPRPEKKVSYKARRPRRLPPEQRS